MDHNFYFSHFFMFLYSRPLSLLNTYIPFISLFIFLFLFTNSSLHLFGSLPQSMLHLKYVSLSSFHFKSSKVPFTMKSNILFIIDFIFAVLCHTFSCFDVSWKGCHHSRRGERVADWKWSCAWSTRRDFRIPVRPLLILLCLWT